MNCIVLFCSGMICVFVIFVRIDFFNQADAILTHYYSDFMQYIWAVTKISMPLLSKSKLFTKDELAAYTGKNGEAVYLSILGNIFDVTNGRKYYGHDGSYSFFAGRDSSRAFVSGDFTEKGLSEDLTGLSDLEILSIQEWLIFYKEHYTYVGKLSGIYHNSDGSATAALTKYEDTLDQALQQQKIDDATKQVFPPCNSNWKQGKITFWCSELSGGIKRNWIGVPRQFHQPGLIQSKPQCVCVRNTGPPSNAKDINLHSNVGDLDNPNIRPYSMCDRHVASCSFTINE